MSRTWHLLEREPSTSSVCRGTRGAVGWTSVKVTVSCLGGYALNTGTFGAGTPSMAPAQTRPLCVCRVWMRLWAVRTLKCGWLAPARDGTSVSSVWGRHLLTTSLPSDTSVETVRLTHPAGCRAIQMAEAEGRPCQDSWRRPLLLLMGQLPGTPLGALSAP